MFATVFLLNLLPVLYTFYSHSSLSHKCASGIAAEWVSLRYDCMVV